MKPRVLERYRLGPNTEVVVMCIIGLIFHIADGYPSTQDVIKLVWNTKLPCENFSKLTDHVVKTILAVIAAARCYTSYIYSASYLMVIWSIYTDSKPFVMLPWVCLSSFRSILNFVTCAIGIFICASMNKIKQACFEFFAVKAIDITISLYHCSCVIAIFKEMIRWEQENTPARIAERELEERLCRRRVRSMIDDSTLQRTLTINDFSYEEVPRLVMQMQMSHEQLIKDFLIPDGMLVGSIADLGSFENVKESQSLNELRRMETQTAEMFFYEDIDDWSLPIKEQVMKILKLSQHDIALARIERKDFSEIYNIDKETWKKVKFLKRRTVPTRIKRNLSLKELKDDEEMLASEGFELTENYAAISVRSLDEAELRTEDLRTNQQTLDNLELKPVSSSRAKFLDPRGHEFTPVVSNMTNDQCVSRIKLTEQYATSKKISPSAIFLRNMVSVTDSKIEGKARKKEKERKVQTEVEQVFPDAKKTSVEKMVVDEPRSKATSIHSISPKTSKISPKVSVKSLKKSPVYKKGSRHLNIIKTFKNIQQEENTPRSKGTKTKKIQIKKALSKPTSKKQTSDVVQTMTKQVSYLTELIKNPFADSRGNCSAKKNTEIKNAMENCWKSDVLKKLSRDSNMGIDILKQKDKKRLYNPIPKFDFEKLRKHIFQLFTLRTVETPKNEVRLLKNVKNQKPRIEDGVETKKSIKTEDKSTVTDDLKGDVSPSTKKKDKMEEVNVLPSKKRELKPVNEVVVSECQSKKETRGSETSSSKSSSSRSKVIYELKPIERVVMTFEEKNKQVEKLKDDQSRRKVVEEKVVYRSKCVTEDIVWLNASYRTRFPTESDLRQLSARNKQALGIKRILGSKKTNDFSKTQPSTKHTMSPVHSSPAESYNSLSSASSSDSFNLYYSKEADLSSPWFDQRNFSEVNFNKKSFPKRKYEAQMKALENNNLKISRRPMDISFAQKDINFPPINLLTPPEDIGLNQRQKRKWNISRHEDKIIEMEDESTDNDTSSVSTARTKSATTDVGSQCNSLSKRWIKKQEKLIQERKSSSLGDESRRKSKTREIIEEFLNKYRSILRYRCKRTEESLQEKKMAKSTHRVKKVYYDAVNVLPEKRDSADNFYKSPNVTESTKLLHSNLGRDMISLNPAYFLERVKRKNEPGQNDREERLKKVIARIEKDMFIQDNTFHRRFRYP